MREHDARAVNRHIATKDVRLRPRVVVIDECQNLFLGKHGKAAIEVASKLMSTAQKYAIRLMFLTPEPSKDALPRKIITIASNKACFAIGDQNGNDAVLGDQPRMKTQELLQRLTERDRATYGDWTLQRLTSSLAEHNAGPYKTKGFICRSPLPASAKPSPNVTTTRTSTATPKAGNPAGRQPNPREKSLNASLTREPASDQR